MRKASFDKGVLAAARVACALAIVGVGCTGSTERAYDTEFISATDTEEVVNATDTDTGEVVTATDTDVDPLADCEEQVTDVFADGGTPTESDLECCQLIADYYDSVNGEGMDAWEERDACCSALDWQGSTACTPWGPPCPPSMRGMA